MPPTCPSVVRTCSSTRSRYARTPAGQRTSGVGQSAVFPRPARRSSTARPSPTLAVAGSRRRSSVRPEPIAPANPAGRPASGSGRTDSVSARLDKANRSSWLKNWSATGVLYLRVARGTTTLPGTSGNTTWWETNRSYHRPRMLRVAAMPLGVVCGKLHTPSITGGCSVGGRRSCCRRSRGNQAAVTTSTCSPTRTLSGETSRSTAGCPGGGGGARSSIRRRRGLSVDAVAARFAATSTITAPASTVSAPCTARAGPSGQWPCRTARSRISSTVVRIGPASKPTSVRSLRSTISRPVNGGRVTCMGTGE